MPLDKGSAAMGFEIKETKRQSRAVKVTHPPAARREEKPCGFVHHFCRRQKWWAMRASSEFFNYA